jgi:hypothetical protein
LQSIDSSAAPEKEPEYDTHHMAPNLWLLHFVLNNHSFLTTHHVSVVSVLVIVWRSDPFFGVADPNPISTQRDKSYGCSRFPI